MKETGVLSKEAVLRHAEDHRLLMVFHSNKIEGNPLTQGETDAVLRNANATGLSKNQREAYNVQTAYLWLLDNHNEYADSPETFIRQLNKTILDGVSAGGGQYRSTQVKIAGMEFTPPHQSAVPAFMEELGKEIKQGATGRSVLEFAATIHTKLVYIHPFVDANGRTARLLMNAILLSYNLPVIIVNFADKQRYLEALSQSNAGDLSALVMYFVECMREQFEELKSRGADKEEIADEVLAGVVTEKPVDDPVEKALDEMGLKPDEDPLASVMALTIQKIKAENYDAWRQAYGSLLSDMKVLVGKYNEQYKTAGFRMTLREYDMLSYEKYVDIYGSKKVSRTWFFSVEIINPMNTRVRFLLFFERITQALETKFKNVNKVCLTIARFDGVTYPRLTSEPITLRKIVYLDGELVFIGREDEIIEKSGDRNISHLLRRTLAEFIKTYLLT